MTKNRYNPLRLRSIIVTLCLMLSFSAFAQVRPVTGTVVDATGETVIGATVRVGDRGTITNFNGQFTIDAAPTDMILITFIGYNDLLVPATQTELGTLTLVEDAEILGEVVVIGYGTRRRELLTGAVATVSGDDIRTTRNESVVNMIAGRMPGVRVQQTTAMPGAFDISMDIRGMGTPLIIVDGIPRDMGYLHRMDASEIDNLSILKDASAAIFGVQAANGVILVTTRRGTGRDNVDIRFSTNFTFQTFKAVPNTLDVTSTWMLQNEIVRNSGMGGWFHQNPPHFSWDEIFEFSSGARQSTIWTEEMFQRVAPQQQHNLTINGSTGRIDYFFNLGYMEQVGILRSGSLWYDRWNFRSNVDVRITDHLRMQVGLSGHQDERNEPHGTIWMLFRNALSYGSHIPAWLDYDRSQNMPYGGTLMPATYSPMAEADHRISGLRTWRNNHFSGHLRLRYNVPFVQGLTLSAMYAYTQNHSNNRIQQRTFNQFFRDELGNLQTVTRHMPGTLRREFGTNWNSVLNLQMDYNRTFGDHRIEAMVLFEERYTYSDGFFAQRRMFFDAEYLSLGDTDGQIGGSGTASDMSRRSVPGRIGYTFRNRYVIDYIFRLDGSSRFPQERRWGYFQALALRWNFSQEDFMRFLPFVTGGALRASFGQTGHDGGAPNYPQTTLAYTVSGNRGWFFGDSWMAGVNPTAIPNLQLTWYTINNENIGMDLDFWNGQLSWTGNLFRRTRHGLMRTPEVELPAEVGAAMPAMNIESDRQFGWEMDFGHRNRVGDLNYRVSVNFAGTMRRWVHRLDTAPSSSWDEWRNRTTASGRNQNIWMSIAEAGRFTSLEQIRNHNISGGNLGSGSLPGDFFYYDWNRDGVINAMDYHPIANHGLPVFNYGITGQASWRNWDVAMLWQGAARVFRSLDHFFTEWTPVMGRDAAILDFYLDRWRTANIYDNPWHIDTQWIQGHFPAAGRPIASWQTGMHNMSFLRLKNFEIGYTLPQAWLTPIGITNVRLHTSGYNLLTLSRVRYIDPERPGANVHPINRTFTVGGAITF